jgi:hypothetical protein
MQLQLQEVIVRPRTLSPPTHVAEAGIGRVGYVSQDVSLGAKSRSMLEEEEFIARGKATIVRNDRVCYHVFKLFLRLVLHPCGCL